MESLKGFFQKFNLLRTCMEKVVCLEEANKKLLQEKMNLEKVAEDLRVLLARALENAVKDPLTGLNNLRFLTENIGLIFSAQERARSPLGLLAVDLDNFKAVNDTHGHDVGDRVLLAAATAFRQVIRETDRVVRVGGDEFIIILTNVREKESLELVAGKLMKAIRAMKVDGCSVPVTLSIGGLLINLDEKYRLDFKPEKALKRVDDFLYVSKQNGRDRATIHAS